MTYTAPTSLRAEAAAIKTETTYGTDIVPGASTDAVRLTSRCWVSITPDAQWPNNRDDVMNQSYVPLPAAPATGKKCPVRAQGELRGKGSDYTSAAVFVDYHAFLQCSGWNGAWSATPSDQWTYAPITSGLRPSASLYVWANGALYKIVGLRGNITFTLRAGERIIWEFAGEGILASITSTSAATATLSNSLPQPAVGGSCTIGSWSPDYDEIVINSGNQCDWLTSGNAADGLQSYDYGVSMPTLTLRGSAVPPSTYDPMADWFAATSRAFTLSWGGSTFNRGVFTDSGLWIPRGQQPSNRKGFTGITVNYRCTAPQLVLN